MKLKTTLLALLFSVSYYAQKIPVEIVSISKYHFKIQNISDSKIEFILENRNKKNLDEKKPYVLGSGQFLVFLKKDYKKKYGATVTVLNSDFNDIVVWDSDKMARDGVQITNKNNLAFAFMITKSDFNDFWEGKGNNFQWNFHYSLGPLPEVRMSDNVYNRFFISADYERITHNLFFNERVFLKSDYINNPTQDYYEINEKEDVSLNFVYGSFGLFNRFTFLSFGHIDFGIKIPVLKKDYVDFSDSNNEVSTSKFNPRGEIVENKLRNHIIYDNSILNNTIYFIRIGLGKSGRKYYQKVPSNRTRFGFGFYFMNPQVMPSETFPLYYEAQDGNNNIQLSQLPLERSGFSYMVNFHLTLSL